MLRPNLPRRVAVPASSLLVVGCAAVVAAALHGYDARAASALQTVTFVPDADARVEEANPAINFGTSTKLDADLSPHTESFLRFTVTGLAEAPVSAKLRLYLTNGSSDGPAVRGAGSGWGEATVTWSTKPAVDPTVLDDKGAVPANAWLEYDVTRLITGNGTYTLALVATSSDGVDANAREATTNRPELVLTLGGSSPPDTTIDSGPSGTTNSTTATFTYSATPAGASFECALDGGGYTPCTSPTTYTNLVQGLHSFGVRASNANGTDPTPATRTWTIDPNPAEFVVAAAGDIASCNGGAPDPDAEATAALVDAIAPDAVLTLGDHAYESGTLAEFQCGYAPTWGRHFGRTYPVPGNHEYNTPGAAGYFEYFGSRAQDPAKGYYSFDLGNWHIVALNSECSQVGGCGPGSPQETWLRQDLAAASTPCIAAYWHKPVHSSGFYRPGVNDARPLYQALDEHGADLVLVAHDHNYERFARQSADGALDLVGGVRQFTVGTGGAGLYVQGPAIANSEVRNSVTRGVLKLTLRTDGYDWQFVPLSGSAFTDTGRETCAGTPPDGVTPVSPSNLAAAGTPDGIALTWSEPSDDVGVIAHLVYRNGALLATTTAVTAFTDAAAAPGQTYTYEVRARDAAGNVSGPSNSVTATGGTVDRLTFVPEADARVEEANPGVNFGAATALDADLTPRTESYLRFSVSGLVAAPTAAKLRLYVTNGSSDGPAVHGAGSGWSETTITWATKPAFDPVALEDKAVVTANSWVEYDVTGLVTSNGTYTLAFVPTSSDGVDAYAREAGVNGPELVLTLASGTTPPDTTIDSGPSGTTSSSTATFTYSATPAGASFECALDGGGYTPCSPPTTYTSLSQGLHTFGVRATDANGTDPTPATRTWTIDSVAPETTIDSGPTGTTTATSATFGFSSSEAGSTFQCSLDGAAFVACSSPATYSGVANGSHTFAVRAADVAGNTDPSPATRTWTVDTASVPTVLTFAAVADARVEQRSPDANYGTATTLVTDLSPLSESYLRFTVSGVTGTVTSAKLRLYASSGTVDGPSIFGAGSTWAETGITWNTRPARTTGALDNKAGVAGKAWVEYDVRAVVSANGTYTFVLGPESTDGMTVSSREASATANRPQLVVQFVTG